MVDTLVVKSEYYEIGDRVDVWSVSKRIWFQDGIVIDIDKAGRIKVVYNKVGKRLVGNKWVKSADVLTCLKKRLPQNVVSGKTYASLLEKQIQYLDRVITAKQAAITSIAEELKEARFMRQTLGKELLKIPTVVKALSSEGERLLSMKQIVLSDGTSTASRHASDTSLWSAGAAEAKALRPIEDGHQVARLAESMIFALRWSIMRLNCKINELKSSHFREVVSTAFPMAGATAPYHTPAHRFGDFEFKDYAPRIFKKMRQEHLNMSEIEYLETIAANHKFLEFISNSRSGAFFFFSHNGRFMIKTISKAECDFLRSSLRDYYNHVKAHPNTLLAKIFGLHRVKIRGRSLKFVVMESLLHSPRFIHLIFDLKGSRGHTRIACPDDLKRAPTERFTTTVLKDNDFVEREMSITIGSQRARELVQLLRADVEYLRKHRIVDYSLLVGIHDKGAPVPKSPELRKQAKIPQGDCWRRTSLGGDQDGDDAETRSESVHARSDSDFEFASSSAADTPRAEDGGVRLHSIREGAESTLSSLQSEDKKSPRSTKSPSSTAVEMASSGRETRQSDEAKRNSDVPDGSFAREWPGKGRCTGRTFFIGIIDSLIQYGVRKKMEHTYKTSIKRQSEADVSVIPPDKYAQRFLDFLLPRIV